MAEQIFENGYALLIGTGSDENIRRATVGDAESLGRLLIENAHYPADQVKVLTYPGATKKDIRNGFEWLMNKADEEATVIIFYSGHGGVPSNIIDDFYLEPSGFDENNKDTLISKEEFKNYVNSITAKKTIIFLSSCFAGGVGIALGTKYFQQTENLVDALDSGKGRIILSSSHATQESWIENRDKSNTIFGEVLIEALRGRAAPPSEKYVDIHQVISYVFQNVEKKAAEINRVQKPVLRIPVLEDLVRVSVNEGYDSNYLINKYNGKDFRQETASIESIIREKEEKRAVIDESIKGKDIMPETINLYKEKYSLDRELTALRNEQTFLKFHSDISNIIVQGRRAIIKLLVRKRIITLESIQKESGNTLISLRLHLEDNTEELKKYGIDAEALDMLDPFLIEKILK